MSYTEVRPYTSEAGHTSHDSVLPEFYYTSKTHSSMSAIPTNAPSGALSIPSKTRKLDKHGNYTTNAAAAGYDAVTVQTAADEEAEMTMMNNHNTNCNGKSADHVYRMNAHEAFQILTAPIGYDLPAYMQGNGMEIYAPHRPSTCNTSHLPRHGRLSELSTWTQHHSVKSQVEQPHGKMISTLPALPSSSNNNSKFDEVATTRLVNALCPPLNRSADEALSEAKLEDPFKHHSNDYHNSQQTALNAEMRGKVEKLVNEWNKSMQQLYKIVGSYPSENSSLNYATTNGLMDYCKCYKCTANDELHVTPQELIDTLQLKFRLQEIEQVKRVPSFSLDSLRRTLDSLLNSPYLLANLQEYVESLQIYDAIALQNKAANMTANLTEETDVKCITESNIDGGDNMETNKEEVSAVPQSTNAITINGTKKEKNEEDEVEEKNNKEEEILPSEAAVALHSKYYMNPTEYADQELHKTTEALLAMEQRMRNAKMAKEAAVDRASPAEALRQLHAEIDFGNDLLLLNKARMLLVSMHNEDVMELREVTLRCINAAQETSGQVQQRIAQLLPRLDHDKAALAESKIALEDEVHVLESKEQDAQRELKMQMEQVEDEEKQIWKEILNSLNKIQESATRKVKLAQQRMSLKEQRARELTAILEQIKAHEEHSNELTECESNLMKWQQASEMYGKYVEVYIPKLLKRLNTIEDEDEELRLRESQEYVRRFENFTYAVEEAKAKREVQVDRMRLLQRSCVRNEEWADATLDPAKQQYSQRFAEANKEIDEVSSYLEYLHNIESDRKDEVEPILHQVIAYNTAMQGTMEANKYIAAQESVNKDHVEDGTRANEQVLPIQDHTQVESTNANINQKNAGTIMEAHHTDDASSQMPLRTRDQFTESQAPLLATMDHPIITARLIGIAHEEQYLQKHRALNENELSAAEDKRVSVRKSKAELDMMASRYNNVEAIKELLMKDLQSHKE